MDWIEGITHRLPGLGDISVKAMFGGQGVIFGIVFQERLYFKVDDENKGDYVARGMLPFRPNERQTLKSYFEVPSEVIKNDETLLSWTGAAIRAGQNSHRPLR